MSYKMSDIAENLSNLSVSAIANEINKKVLAGEKIYNLTVGDFNPAQFPIPKKLEEEIIQAYKEKFTNYPRRGNAQALVEELSSYIKDTVNLDYKPQDFVIAAGARPLIYTLFQTLVDPGDKVIYPIPSWNNHNYVQLHRSHPILIETKPKNNFMLTAEDLEPHIKDAVLVVLNAPLNPTGTSFDRNELKRVFDLIVQENKRRAGTGKYLYVMFDIVYKDLVFPKTIDGILSLNPDVKDYIIFIDAISKCFAATGVRVGWAFGPNPIIDKMTSILSHLGAWAGHPEQIGVARFLAKRDEVENYISNFRDELLNRLNLFYDACIDLKQQGFDIDVTKPQGSLYLAIKLNLIGKETEENDTLLNADDILMYVMDKAKMAIVPFYIFGTSRDSIWFRLSVGNCSVDEAKISSKLFKEAIMALK